MVYIISLFLLRRHCFNSLDIFIKILDVFIKIFAFQQFPRNSSQFTFITASRKKEYIIWRKGGERGDLKCSPLMEDSELGNFHSPWLYRYTRDMSPLGCRPITKWFPNGRRTPTLGLPTQIPEESDLDEMSP